VVAFVEVGQDANVQGDINEAIQRGVERGYLSLRASVVHDPLFDRRNTENNTPALLHVRIVPGDKVTIHLAEKGFGSENKSQMVDVTDLTDEGLIKKSAANI
jgi:fumarate hydratase subunit alpha